MSGHVSLWVPERDREYVRQLGAQWDVQSRSWYISSEMDSGLFAPWIDYFLYIVLAKQKCAICHNQTRVVAFGLPVIHEGLEYLTLIPRFECAPFEIRSYLLDQGIRYQPTQMQRPRNFQLMSCCEYCCAPQSDYLLFSAPDGAFSGSSVAHLDHLDFYRVRLAYPCMINDMFSEYRRRTKFGYGLVESCEYWYDFGHDFNRILYRYALARHTRLSLFVSELVRPCLAP